MIHIEIVYNQMLDSSITRPVARHHEALFFISMLSIWHKTAAVGAIADGDLQRRALYGAQRSFFENHSLPNALCNFCFILSFGAYARILQ